MTEPVPIAVFVSGSGSNLEALLAAASCGFAAVRVAAVVSDEPGAFGLLRAARRGVRVVMVTHDIGQARRLGHDIVLMHRGRVAEHGLSHDLFETPRTETARRFLAGALII